jgi:hypothetical protein
VTVSARGIGVNGRLLPNTATAPLQFCSQMIRILISIEWLDGDGPPNSFSIAVRSMNGTDITCNFSKSFGTCRRHVG